MKKTLLILFGLMFSINSVQSQRMNKERIKLLKTSYLTEALDLSSDEAEKFWPIYNKYSNKIQKLKFSLEGGMIRNIKQAGGIENISESDAQKLIATAITSEQQITEYKTEMLNKLSNIISAKKLLKLHKAERDFNRKLLHEFGKRRRLQGK